MSKWTDDGGNGLYTEQAKIPHNDLESLWACMKGWKVKHYKSQREHDDESDCKTKYLTHMYKIEEKLYICIAWFSVTTTINQFTYNSNSVLPIINL